MTNAFVGYFNNVRRIFTERNAWYRILVMIVVACLYEWGGGSFQQSLKNLTNNLPTNFNMPLILLTILCGILIFGYNVQIYSNRMNLQDNLIPKIDFLQMFINGLKAIPFYFVWGVYLSVAIIAIGLLTGLFMIIHLELIAKITAVLGFLILLFVYVPVLFSVFALFAKDFDYGKTLNPVILFKLLPSTLGGIYFACLASFLMGLGIFLTVGLFTYFSYKSLISLQPELAFAICAIGILVFLYILQVMRYAFDCTIAEVTREATQEEPAEDEADDNSNDIVDISYSEQEKQDDKIEGK